MVVQKTINNLKERPRDEKTVVAGGIATLVVTVLLIGYGLWIVSNIKRGGQFNTQIADRPQDVFLAPAVREADRALQNTMRSTSEELRELRNSAVDVPPVLDAPTPNADPFNSGAGDF